MNILSLNKNNGQLLGLILGLLLVPAVGFMGWRVWNQTQQKETQTSVATETAPVVQQDITIQVSASGSIQPLTPVNVSPKSPGRLVKLFVDQGDRVTQGQRLAKMDDSDLQGQLLQAQGALALAKANLQKVTAGNRPQEIQQAADNLKEAQANMLSTRADYESNVHLYQAGAISRNAYESSRSAYEAAQARIGSLKQQLSLVQAGSRPEDIAVARAQVQQAAGSLKTIQSQLNDTVIRAPFAGIVTQKYANEGAFVTPTTSASATNSATSSSILALANDLEAVVNVSETDIRSIHPGQAVKLKVDAYPGKPFKGEVRLIAPEALVDQNVTSFQVRIQVLGDSQHQLKSGMNLTAQFLVGEHQGALLIPTTAIVSEANGTAVYLLGEKGHPTLHPIKIGYTVGTQTEVLSGLKLNDRVFITFPGQRQPNGKPVKSSGFGPGANTRPRR